MEISSESELDQLSDSSESDFGHLAESSSEQESGDKKDNDIFQLLQEKI